MQQCSYIALTAFGLLQRDTGPMWASHAGHSTAAPVVPVLLEAPVWPELPVEPVAAVDPVDPVPPVVPVKPVPPVPPVAPEPPVNPVEPVPPLAPVKPAQSDLWMKAISFPSLHKEGTCMPPF
jgi:hypothetical protein